MGVEAAPGDGTTGSTRGLERGRARGVSRHRLLLVTLLGHGGGVATATFSSDGEARFYRGPGWESRREWNVDGRTSLASSRGLRALSSPRRSAWIGGRSPRVAWNGERVGPRRLAEPHVFEVSSRLLRRLRAFSPDGTQVSRRPRTRRIWTLRRLGGRPASLTSPILCGTRRSARMEAGRHRVR